jgi:hypothetical protein
MIAASLPEYGPFEEGILYSDTCPTKSEVCSKKVKAAQSDSTFSDGFDDSPKKRKSARVDGGKDEDRTVPSVTFVEEPGVRSKRVKAARVEADTTNGGGVPMTLARARDGPNDAGSAAPVTTLVYSVTCSKVAEDADLEVTPAIDVNAPTEVTFQIGIPGDDESEENELVTSIHANEVTFSLII